MNAYNDLALALESRLKKCRNVRTLGVKTNFEDYDDQEIHLIRNARKIYYPTLFYAELFDAVGINTFPSYHTYKCVQDKIKQTALFKIAQLPHPKTRVYYGRRKIDLMLSYFSFPFIAKEPRGSAMGRGVFLIQNHDDLEAYLDGRHASYIQQYLPVDRDIRVVVVGKKIALSYWRIAAKGEFRSNVALGGKISFDGVPQKALDLALFTANRCGWDDVGIDICVHEDRFYLLEGNMKYGKEGFREAGIDYYQMMEKKIENNDI